MIEATSCGGVVIFRGKILLLYKNYKNKYEGWVLPKGTVEDGEEFRDTATREVLEETGAAASIIKYIGRDWCESNPDEIYREKSVFIYGTGGCCGEDGALVSDDGRQLLQQTTA